MEVQVYRRTGTDWELETYHENDSVELASVGLTLPVEQIFEDVGL
jgi:Uma2 family endonuclease